jgi:hypothetical protein
MIGVMLIENDHIRLSRGNGQNVLDLNASGQNIAELDIEKSYPQQIIYKFIPDLVCSIDEVYEKGLDYLSVLGQFIRFINRSHMNGYPAIYTPDYVLVDKDSNIHVFGLGDSRSEMGTCVQSIIFWLPPEELLGDVTDPVKKNIFLFGIIGLALFGKFEKGKNIFTKCVRRPMKNFEFEINDLNPRDDVDEGLWNMFLQCVDIDPENRPSVRSIMEKI